ncbi:MAG: vitamin K epoxide reductase family protein [Nannocystaceae bacterium]
MKLALSRPVLGAFTIASFSVIGALWSEVLSLLGLRAGELCGAWQSQGRWGCLRSLKDAWSTLLGIPLVAWSAAFFFTTFILALLLLLAPGRLSRPSQPVFGLLGGSGVITSTALTLRSALVDGVWCELLAVLPATSFGVLLGARIAAPRGLTRASAQPRRFGRGTTALLLVTLAALVAAAAVLNALHRPTHAACIERPELTHSLWKGPR